MVDLGRDNGDLPSIWSKERADGSGGVGKQLPELRRGTPMLLWNERGAS